MDNLMELVNECKQFQASPYNKEIENLVRAEEFRQLGFKRLAGELESEVMKRVKLAKIASIGYLVISEVKIEKYLDKKVARYDGMKKRDKKAEAQLGLVARMEDYISFNSPLQMLSTRPQYLQTPPEPIPSQNIIIARKTQDFLNDKKGTIGNYIWTEEPVEQYATIPPADVLQTMKVHKDRGIFDYMTIASVNEVKDPLLLGRVNGVSDRFFIAQWGDDVKLDDVI